MERWTTTGRRTLLRREPWLTVEEHGVCLPDGATIEDWSWIIAPPYVTVVAVSNGGQVLCLRHYKYAVDDITLGLVAGYIDPGEEPLEAAKRELLEESGYLSGNWRSLGRYVVDANRGAGIAHIFLATEAHQVTRPNAGDLEEHELALLSLEEFRSVVRNGELRVLGWCAAAALALIHLG